MVVVEGAGLITVLSDLTGRRISAAHRNADALLEPHLQLCASKPSTVFGWGRWSDAAFLKHKGSPIPVKKTVPCAWSKTMESWVLEGDSYSFLSSAPCNFNLQHLDGPNHVEIFDITSIPSHRSGISETTCLCDIFGDDSEPPSLSSSPASASFLKKDVDEQLLVEYVNDSSGSYHTANGSEHLSDGSETFEDSKDTKDLLLSETGETNTPASGLTNLPNDKSEVTSANGSPKPAGNRQESHLSQDTSLVQVENSSDKQLVTSTSEFRDTNIRVTGSTQDIISPDLLSENKGIRDQSHATSSELRETDSTEEIITPNLRLMMKETDASSSEQKENDSTQKIITPDSSPQNKSITEQRDTTTSEVRDTNSTQENKYERRESTFSEKRDSNESISNLASEDSHKENNDLVCSCREEEKNSFPDILPTESILFVSETVKCDSSVAVTNYSNDVSDFAPLQKAASDHPAKEETNDLREISNPLEHEDVPSKLANIGKFLCDDKAGLSNLEDPNTVAPSTYVERNTEIDVATSVPRPQHFTVSSETRETILLPEHRHLSSFSDATEGLISCAISELSSCSGPSVDVNSLEPQIIIHSPVGFTVCPSPEQMNKIWSAGPEDLPESPESDYRLTPTDNGSVSSFDSKLFPTPDSTPDNSTPKNEQNVYMCELSHAASSPELRSASCSPEIKIMKCSSPTLYLKSPQIEKKAPQKNISSQNEVLAQTHDVEGIVHAESFISTTLHPKEAADMIIPNICNHSSTQEGIFSPTTLPRDIGCPDLKRTRYTEGSTPNILPANEITNIAMSSNFSSGDRCIISPHSTISTPRGTESPDIHEIRSVESTSTTIPFANEKTHKTISPVPNLSSIEGGMSRSPSTLSIPRHTASPDVMGMRSTESLTSTTLPTKDVENVVSSPILHLSSTEGDTSKPLLNLSAARDRSPPDVDGIISVEGPESPTVLTKESTISPLSYHSPTASNLSIPRDAMSPEVTRTRYDQSTMSTMDPIKEIENVVLKPITNVSSVEEGISRSTSPLSIAQDTMSSDVGGTRCVEISMSTISPPNETTNMVISNICSTEADVSRPPSTISIPRNTAFPEIDKIRCVEIPTSTTVLTNEMKNMASSPINLSLTGSISRPPSNLSIPSDTMCLDMAISPISNHSTTEEGISRPPSSSCVSRITASTDVDGLRCVESPTLTILPTNEAPIGVFNISPTEGGLPNLPSALSVPRDTMSPDVVGTRYTETSNEIPTSEITNLANSFISHLSSTDGGITRPSSTLSIPTDTISPDVDGIRCLKISTSTVLPTNVTNSPSSTEGGISIQPLILTIPRETMSPDVEGTRYNERSKEIQTNKNKNMASSIANLTTPPIIVTDNMSSPKMRYQRSPERCDDHIPAPEICIPLGYTDNHFSTTVSEKVDHPLIDVTGYKMSLKSCSLPQDDCTDIASIPCSQTDKTTDSSPEPPAPKLSVKQIKESWERMNDSISNSLNPWQTPKKILTVSTSKEAKKGNNSRREMFERESSGGEKTFGQMAMRPGEIPSVLHSNNHRVYEGQSCRNKGWSGERVIQEELTLGKGVENIAESSYRGEQVELSFSTRNRKGPANHSPAPSSRDPKSGIPPCYFESPLATQQQQSLLRAQNLQKENKSGAKRLRSTSQSNRFGAGRLSAECNSETSSMGSEFDDADSEVKWFTDQAFRNLSSPQVDYLDVYNLSHGSSTNVSQPSTVDSAGSATWISYADLQDSLQENDDVLCHTCSFLPHGTLDPAKRFEMGGFECVDVAVESKEETRRGKRTVPKRQIQFKRCNFEEVKSTASGRIAMDSLFTQTCSRDTFVRQHSTPASMQEDLVPGEDEIQTGTKMLQKSASLDESSPRSKKASSVIMSVLSKKMDTASKNSSRSEPCENKNKNIETLAAAESSNAERQRSNIPSECSLPSEDFVSKEESPNLQKRRCKPKVPPKPVFKANLLPPNNSPAGVAFQGKTLLKDQIRPPMVEALENKISKEQIFGNNEKEASEIEEKYSQDSGSTIDRTPNCTAICVASTRSRMTNSDSENKHPLTLETHKQQEGSSSTFLSKTPEITLHKSSTINDKNKSSLKTSLCPELEISKDTICEPLLGETIEEQKRFKTGVEGNNEEDNEKNKAKSVVHKVRDVRKLVKNTYNLSFKASNTTHHVEDVVPEKQKEMQPENSHPLHIECKAISWKDKTAPCNKSTTQQDVAHSADKSKMPQTDSPSRRNVGVAKITANTSLSNIQHSDMDSLVGLDKCNNILKSGNCEQSTKLEMPSRPPSKEISSLVFLQDGTPKSIQKPTSPASPNVKTANSSHSVSMLRKEKGMQTDIGVCDVLSEGAGAKPKHINILEVPLQTYASESTASESQKVKKDDGDLPPEQKVSLNSCLQTSEGIFQVRSSPKEVRILHCGKEGDNQSQGDFLQPRKEQEITVAPSSKVEVSAFSSNARIRAMPVTTSKEIELPIQVRSISSDRPKPFVLPKPSYKQPFAEIRSTSNDLPKTDIAPTTSILKEQTHLKSDVKIIETSATVIHNEQSTNTASSSTKTLSVSSHKPQTIPVTTMLSSPQKSAATTGRQEISITSVQNYSNRQQQNIQEQDVGATSFASNYQTLPVTSQANTYMQPTMTTSSNNQLHTDDFYFPSSDDPPSYDERESFSPLHLSDLPPRRQNRYHPTTKHSLCSCTSCTHPQFGQPYHGSQNQTPPASCSPGQVISYPGAPPQAQVRPHQCRPDAQPTIYPSASPKSTVQQAPAMIQPMLHSHTCPAPAIRPYGNEQQQPSTQHMERRSGNQHAPQVPSGATYREHSRSPNIAALDPRSQFFNPQELPSTFGHDFGSDGPGGGGVLYPENASGLGYGQGPRRVLLDPETGKYFYIEVPMQPLRKMLFDPEIGQYVEVLIPQQAMSNSSMYPPTAAPYQGPYHGQGLYTSQYLPYTMPPNPQSAQQPRNPEPSVPTSLHQNTMGYGSSACQVSKSDVKGHPPLDQGYLESMYYIPTGMNASPNSTPSDCYHKPATNMPAAGGRRA